MKTKQADKLIGKEITVSFPEYHDQCTLIIVKRRPRSSIIEAQVKQYGGHTGVFDCGEMELVSIN